MERKEPTTGAKPSKLSVEDLGAIPNLMDRLKIEKLLSDCTTWLEVARKLYSSGVYKQLSGHVIGRVALLTLMEINPEMFENASKAGVDNAQRGSSNSPDRPSQQPVQPKQPGLYTATPIPKTK